MEINYEELISAMILKYGQIDPLDLSLIIDDMKSKYGIEFNESFSQYSYVNIRNYINVLPNGVIKLSDEYNLNDYIDYDTKDISLECFLNKKVGDFVRNYFNTLDYNKIKERKEKLFQKEKVTNNANVLLLSDKKEDYDILKNYGFKKINHFMSIIKADDYFKNHPNELENYDLVINGNCLYAGWYYFKLPTIRKIEDLRLKHVLIDTSSFKKQEWLKHPYETEFYDLDQYRCWNTYSDTVSEMLDSLVICLERNRILDMYDKKFIKIDDTKTKELPSPTKMSDIKILLATSSTVEDQAIEYLRNKGLNIDAIPDNNYTLYKDIIRKLGDYDIIITSDYSKNLPYLAVEALEQDKNTGRKFNLLLTYDDNTYNKTDLIGEKYGLATDITYSFVYDYSTCSNIRRDTIKALREKVMFNDINSEYDLNHKRNEYTEITSTVESAISLYADKLNELGYSKIEDLNLKNISEYNSEYNSLHDTLEKDKAEKDRLISLVDEINLLANKYLIYKDKCHDINPIGLKIERVTGGVKIANILNGRVLCSLIISNGNYGTNVRMIGVETLNKKGFLSNTSQIQITNDNRRLGIKTPISEQQEKVLESIKKKMDYVLKPLLLEEEKSTKEVKQYVKRKK
jgi:hypothetical protein